MYNCLDFHFKNSTELWAFQQEEENEPRINRKREGKAAILCLGAASGTSPGLELGGPEF